MVASEACHSSKKMDQEFSDPTTKCRFVARKRKKKKKKKKARGATRGTSEVARSKTGGPFAVPRSGQPPLVI